jgi:hypothetical protein
MPYYPLSQIQPNLFTNGDEYILNTTKEKYTGYYYKLSSGPIYTGKTPQDGPSILLVPITPLINSQPSIFSSNPQIEHITIKDNLQYTPKNKNQNISQNQRIIPYYIALPPTPSEYNLGTFTRYFCKKINESKYLEIDKNQYDKLSTKDSNIAWDLYTPFLTTWYLKGSTQEMVFNTNKSLSKLIEQKNNFLGFCQYLQENYLKYYSTQDINNLYTPGGEFTTKNGQNYIGFYHMHNGITPMVGKTHTDNPHDVLIPIIKPQSVTQITSSMMLPTSPNIPSRGGSYSRGGSSMGGGGSY